jgi:hypothetical protein
MIDAVDGRCTGGEVIPAGSYQCKLVSIIHENDGIMCIRFTTKPGFSWKVNLVVVNMLRRF